MTLEGDRQALTVDTARAYLITWALRTHVTGVIFRSSALTPATPTGGSLELSGGDKGWAMALDGFRWGLRPTIVADGETLEPRVLDAEGTEVSAENEAERADIESLRAFALLDPRTVLARASEARASGSFEGGAIDCVIDLRDLALPDALLQWLGRSASYHAVRQAALLLLRRTFPSRRRG
jgi:hypothetical protein